MKTTVRGKEIEYGVDETTGIFKARYNGEEYTHATLAGLKGALDRQIKKKPLDIHVIQIEGHWRDEGLGIEHGAVVGIHSGNRNLLIRWRNTGEVEQSRSYRGSLLKGNTDLVKLKALHKKMKDANKAFNDFKEKWAFDRDVIKDDDSELEP